MPTSLELFVALILFWSMSVYVSDVNVGVNLRERVGE